MSLTNKLDLLKALLAKLDRIAVAFSGGVDSTYLLFIAGEVLGSDRVLALTTNSPIFPAREIAESTLLADRFGIRQIIIEGHQLEREAFAGNLPLRCYHCKRDLFDTFLAKAREFGFQIVVEGSNLDDLDDYRPGRKALSELHIISPLLEAGLTKTEIRELSRLAGLSTADKPSSACLASRFPYGTRITLQGLQRVERCEAFLSRHGFRNCRVRSHGELARIEVSLDEMPRMIKDGFRTVLLAECKAAGFIYVALDLEGYRTGSLNESLPLEKT
jgi:uncharacterized protein